MKKFIFILIAILFTMLTGISSTAMAKSKPSIGVAEFKNTSGAGWWRGGMGWDIAGLVTSELASIGSFNVVERNKLQHVLKEQDLAASGKIRSGTAAKIGKLTGAKYLVMGTVTAYEESTSGTGGGISLFGVSVGGKKEKAYISVDLRVVDTTTGEIKYTRAIEANASSGGMDVGVNIGGVGANLGGFEKTPAGKAVRACVIEIVDYLDCAMVKKDSCLADFDAKEQRRREKTKSAISLDE